MKRMRQLLHFQRDRLQYGLVFTVFLLAISPNLFSEGMFVDGLLYSSIARNLSQGIGDFWHLSFSNTAMHQFYGHPPLAIWIQSLFYRVLGEGYWVEKIYALSTILVQTALMGLVWKEVWKQVVPKVTPAQVLAGASSVWALGVFLLSPLVLWASTNVVLENTLSIFVLLSVWCFFRALRVSGITRYSFLLLAGMALFAGLLSKAFVGLFVWGLPLAWWLSKASNYRLTACFRDVFLLVSCTLLPLVLLLVLSDAAHDYARMYWSEQMIGSLYIKQAHSRWYLFRELMQESIPMGMMLVGVFWWTRKRSTLAPEQKKVAMAFLYLALFGIIPLLFSFKQRNFYLLTAWPYFAMSIAAWMPTLQSIKQKKWMRSTILIGLGLSMFLMAFFSSRTVRQKELIADVHRICTLVPEGSTLQISVSMTQHWCLYGYLARYAQISLDHHVQHRHPYLLLQKGKATPKDLILLKAYEPLDEPLQRYRLYRLKQTCFDAEETLLPVF